MNTLIIGANGYLGSNIARELMAHGNAVSGLARDAELGAQMATNSVASVEGTLTDLGWEPTLFDIVQDIRYGSYKAAYKPRA